ncbi:hypothetical protein [Corynebacterium kalidii]|uniref:Secreted protein n=1 Tax=Corynebacterium kalidii TaxID=2931982 RepID=A0A9X1WFN8_9CORY|nr:hypothetical protein [Corynebacterium kalidii]MCJ7857586.1 hypothetical protein [Corynebacterium kalidii]
MSVDAIVLTMKTRLASVAAAVAIALSALPSAHGEPDLLRIYDRTGTVTESNPLGVPEPDDVADLGLATQTGYINYMSNWWEYNDYLKPNCARHVTAIDATLWYFDPENFDGVSVVNHYPGKTGEQCAAENGLPSAPTPGGSISGSLAAIGS